MAANNQTPLSKSGVKSVVDRAAIEKQNQTDSKASAKQKKLRRIEIKTRKLSNQVFSGSYHTAFKGRGISFSEVREYQYGDDIRAIDWNVTARAGRPFIKVFEEEREMTLMLLIDVSRSTLFGTQTEFKKEIIEIISGILAFSAITNNDKVGVIFFSDKVEKFIPAKKGKSHIMRIISEIDGFDSPQTPKGGLNTSLGGAVKAPFGGLGASGTSIAQALKYFNNVNKKKSIAFLISDFMSQEDFHKELNISARKHDFIGIQIYDKRERLMENIGTVLIKDAESGAEFFADTSDPKLRMQIQKTFDEQQKATKQLFGRSGAQYISIDTTVNYVTELMKMFKDREIRR
jgi:uncharacterized protein (DUF58 family)